MILVIKLGFKHLQEAISFGKKVALVEMGQNGKGIRNRFAKEAIIQAALMRITIGQSEKSGHKIILPIAQKKPVQMDGPLKGRRAKK
jgi:hypothetical protein